MAKLNVLLLFSAALALVLAGYSAVSYHHPSGHFEPRTLAATAKEAAESRTAQDCASLSTPIVGATFSWPACNPDSGA